MIWIFSHSGLLRRSVTPTSVASDSIQTQLAPFQHFWQTIYTLKTQKKKQQWCSAISTDDCLHTNLFTQTLLLLREKKGKRYYIFTSSKKKKTHCVSLIRIVWQENLQKPKDKSSINVQKYNFISAFTHYHKHIYGKKTNKLKQWNGCG